MPTSFPTFVDLPQGEEPEPGVHVLADAAYLNSVNVAVNTLETTLPGKADTGDLATVATTGAYTDLIGKPFIPDSADDIGAQPVDADLTAVAALTPTNNDLLQRKAGVWTNRTPAQVKTDLALTATDVGLGNVTNTAQIPVGTFDAKGDLVVASAADTVARLPAGTNGQVLKANSATATGLEWAAESGGSGIAFTIIDAKGDLIAGTAADTAARLAVGTNGQVLKADSTAAAGLVWADANAHTHALSAITISGVPDGTKFLRDDGSWATPTTLVTTRTVSYSATPTIDPTIPGNRINMSATGDITAYAVSTVGAQDGQVLQLVTLASGGSRNVTFAAALRTTTGVARGPYTVTSGQLLRAAVEFSTLTNAWALLAATVTAS